MTALHADDTSRCPVAPVCLSCGTNAAGARTMTPCTGAPDLCGAPAGQACEPGCPSLAAEPEPGPLAVATAGTPVGMLCMTLCWGCSAAGWLPRLTAGAAMRMVMDHAAHIGRDADGEPIGGPR